MNYASIQPFSPLTFLMTKAEFVPPKPKELLKTVFTSISMVFAVRLIFSEYSSRCSKLILGATK